MKNGNITPLVDLERAAISCLVHGADHTRLTAAHFADRLNQRIFDIVRAIAADGGKLSVETIALSLQSRDTGEPIGLDLLMQIAGTFSDATAFSTVVDGLEASRIERERKRVGSMFADVTAFSLEDCRSAAAAIGAPAGSGGAFTIWAPSQFLNFAADPSANLLADGVLARGCWTSFVGVGGLGKTRLALWLAIAQILGRQWCGLPTGGDPQKFLMLSSENGIARWKNDLTKIFAGLTDDEREKIETHLRILAMVPGEDSDLCLENPATSSRIRVTLERSDPGVVIFDPWSDIISGDENSNTDVLRTLRHLRAIIASAAPTAGVMTVHHARTGSANQAQAGDNFSAGNFGRGGKALYSKVRAEIQLAPADRDDDKRLVLSCGKHNDGQKFAPRGIRFNQDTFAYDLDPDFNLTDWRDDVAGKRRELAVTISDVVTAVREKYRPGDDVATADIVEPLRERTGASAKTIQRRLYEAKAASYLRDGAKRGTWRLGSKPLKL